jgi:tetratricopeptide (TPR) repeat protein
MSLNSYNCINLFSTDGLIVDAFVRTGNESLCVTFTPHGNKILSGSGFGGDFLMQENFDVLAFKTDRDDWYQSLEISFFLQISSFLNKYKFRVGYGSSMGAYALLLFSKLLMLDKALLFSPQFSIWDDFDVRWAMWAKKNEQKFFLSKGLVSAKTQFYVAYDNRSLDNAHVQMISKLLPHGNLTKIELPYSGHPSLNFIHELGRLKSFCLNVFNGILPVDISFYSDRHSSTSFLTFMANTFSLRSRHFQAIHYINKAISIRPDVVAYYKMKSDICFASGDPGSAINAAEKAIELSNSNFTKSHMLAHLCGILVQIPLYDLAVKHMLLAVDLMPDDAYFKLRLSVLYLQTSEINNAIYYARQAVELEPTNESYQQHYKSLISKFG